MSSSVSEFSYLPFELLIGASTPNGYPVTVVDSPAGDGEAICTLQVDAELQEALGVIESGIINESFLSELGAFFYHKLFTGDVATLYRTSLGMARSQAKRLRIRLRIAPPELAALPWEYLYDGHEDLFLATSAETALVRYVPINLPVRTTTVSLPLRVLVVIANPKDTQQLEVDREKAIVQEALAEWEKQGRVQLEIVEPGIADEISQTLRRFQPHVFHFIGHGAFEQERAYLILEDEAGNANPVDERIFREFFNGCQETRLAVLNACQTATLSSSQPLIGLAPRLLQRQLSAVVAMQHPIPDKTSLIFTREFYRSLALGAPVDVAISEARRGIFVESGGQSRDWGTPVLFLRAKDGLLFKVEASEAKSLEIPAPPEPTRPPEVLGFVGRDADLTYYAEKLETAHLAVIAGMAGVGKTALAAKLTEWVARDRDRVFWHSFHEGEGIDVILWRLAGFLAWHGRSDLWKLLQSARLTGGKPPPSETLFDYVLQLSRGGNFIFCFDDFHHVDDDPSLNQLVERLRAALVAGELSIILTSRRIPDFVTLAEFNPLVGLNATDAHQLLLLRGLRLTESQSDELYKNTCGNAEFLTLAINVLQQARDPDVLISRLAESDDIERYLLQEVDETLTGQERALMGAVAVLLGYPGNREVIDVVLNGPNVFRVLRRLTERHLLMTQEGSSGRGYLQHSMVQSFYYEQTSRSERKRMHGRAGQFYRDEEKNPLQAGIHFERAGEVVEAARLVTQDLWAILNQGQVRQLCSLLERFTEDRLAVESWIEVNLAKGQVYSILAESELAERSLQIVLEQVEWVGDAVQRRTCAARACRGMGELLEDRAPATALKWFKEGLERLERADQIEEAALYIRSGTIYFFLNQYEAARAAAEYGITLLPSKATRWGAIALRDLSGIYNHIGDFRRSMQYAAQSMGISRQLNNPFDAIVPTMNLAIALFSSGDTRAGLDSFTEAAALAQQTGNESLLAQVEMNLGTAHMSMGEFASAHEHLHKSLHLATRQGNQRIRLYSLRNLIDLYVSQKEWVVATPYLEEAEALAQELGDKHNLLTLYGLWCEVKSANQEFDAALTYANRGFTLAVELAEIVSQGVSKASMGKLLATMGCYDEAFANFTESLALIGNEDPYQAALTKMDWGMALLIADQIDEGMALLHQAKLQLLELEALDLVKEIDTILTTNKETLSHLLS